MRCLYVMYQYLAKSFVREGIRFAGRAILFFDRSRRSKWSRVLLLRSGLAPLWPDLLFGISVQGSARTSPQYMSNKDALATRQGPDKETDSTWVSGYLLFPCDREKWRLFLFMWQKVVYLCHESGQNAACQRLHVDLLL